MEEIILDDEEIATYAKLFKYREVSKDKFFLTFYNGHLEAFYKFLVHIIRKHFRHLDCFSNAQMLNANYLVKHHGMPCGIYHGSWLSGSKYLVTLTPGLGVIGEEFLYIYVQSEADAVEKAMTQIHDAIFNVKSVWGTDKLKEAIVKEIVNACQI